MVPLQRYLNFGSMRARNKLVFSLLFLPLALFGQILPYDNQVIETIDVELMTQGDSHSKSSILSRMSAKRGGLFSQTQFDRDLKALAQEFDWVEPAVYSVNGKIQITLKVWPKPLIRSIVYCGNKEVHTSELQDELEIAPFTLFDRVSFNTAFHKLRTLYIKKGYFESTLSYNLVRDECTNEVDIEIIIKEGRSGRIKGICFCGLDDCEMDDILDLMVTQRWNIVSAVMDEAGYYNEDKIQYDQFQVLNYLQNHGYADAKVKFLVTDADRPRWINLHIHVTKGVQYRFGEISFEGNELYDDEAIEKLICIKEGDCFSPDAMRNALQNLQDAYGARGYLEAIIDDDLTLDCDGPVYDLHLDIEEGEQYRVGLIKVFGNNFTQTRVLLHETLLVPGDVFNILRLKATEERLRNIGYFKTVNVYAVKCSSDSFLGDCYRDVHIEVEEDSTGNIGAFLGFSTGDDLMGGFNITEKNFNIRGINYKKLMRYGPRCLKGGGEYLHFTAQFGQKTNNYALSWTKPYFKDTAWAIGVDLERSFNRAIAQDYNLVAHSGSFHAKRPLNAFTLFGWHYRLRDSNVRITGHQKTLQLQEAQKQDGLVSATGVSLTYNSTNHPVRPNDGIRSTLSAEFVGLGGSAHFLSLSYINSFYYAIGKKGVLRYRADFKTIQTFDTPSYLQDDLSTVPIDERFFLGGDYQVRGYRPYAIGPKFIDTSDPRGGLSMLLLSAEYDYLLHPRLQLFAFADAGNVFEDSWRQFDLTSVKASVGYGAKLHIMGGAPPLIIGMGYPLNADSRSDIKRFFISIGAKF